MVITIGCEYGSGGPEIGKAIADYLGIEYYDRDLVDKVVEQIGVDRELVEKADTENNVKYEFDTKFGPRYANLTNRVIYNQFEVIQKFAEKIRRRPRTQNADRGIRQGRCSARRHGQPEVLREPQGRLYRNRS